MHRLLCRIGQEAVHVRFGQFKDFFLFLLHKSITKMN